MKLNSEKMKADRLSLQALIYKLQGKEIIDAKTTELCDNCEHNPCILLPVTINGEDCPYFERTVNSGEQTADPKVG